MSFCRNCGTSLYEGSKFCPECGTPVITDIIEPKAESKEEPRHEEPRREQPKREEPVYEGTVIDEKKPVYGTNGLAIAGFICAFLFPFIGLILSIVAYKNAKSGKYEKPQRSFAFWGIIVGAVLLGLRIIFGIVSAFVLFPAVIRWITQLVNAVTAAVI